MNKTSPATAPHMYDKRTPLTLGRRLGAGREGEVHQVTNRPGKAVKLISPANPDAAATAAKLEIMVKNPPPATATRAYRIAWPTALVARETPGGPTTGYLMPVLDPAVYRPVGAYFNPARRRGLTDQRKRGYSYLNLLAIARNLAGAVAALHRHHVVIGDLNSRNVLATDRGRVAIIDADSFQITDQASGLTHRGLVGTPEYTPPRLQGRDFADVDRTQQDDLFALAIMLYQLLVQGSHPHAGTQPQTASPEDANIAGRIALGRFAHDTSSTGEAAATANTGLIWKDLPLKKQFKAAFQERRPRTSAQAWIQAISEIAARARPCPIDPLHWHFTRRCTWCKYRTTTGVEPFPAPGEARSRKQRGTRVTGQRKRKPALAHM